MSSTPPTPKDRWGTGRLASPLFPFPLAFHRRPRYPSGMEQIGNIPPRYAIRLGDLRHWHVVTVTCPTCGHKGRVDAARLGRGRPDHTRLMDLERKLRCRLCGNREDNRILVSMASRE
jgi:hypothetical protein